MKLPTVSDSPWSTRRLQTFPVNGSSGTFLTLIEKRKTRSKYRQIGIKANEAPTYPLLKGNECTSLKGKGHLQRIFSMCPLPRVLNHGAWLWAAIRILWVSPTCTLQGIMVCLIEFNILCLWTVRACQKMGNNKKSTQALCYWCLAYSKKHSFVNCYLIFFILFLFF